MKSSESSIISALFIIVRFLSEKFQEVQSMSSSLFDGLPPTELYTFSWAHGLIPMWFFTTYKNRSYTNLAGNSATLIDKLSALSANTLFHT